MARYAMLIDASRCTGCGACRVACQMQHQLPPNMSFNRLEFRERGIFPTVKQEIVPVQCMHCDNPPCLHVCPTNATYKRSDGIVLVDHDKCIGCKYCMTACPYDARTLNEKRVPEKCKFCSEYVVQGQEPPCASTCMCSVRIFGDLDDPDSEISKAMAKKSVYQLIPEKGTRPRIYYVKK
ncbi:4Fe-4S ferredoxin [Desulfuribacillus stibiiarsenatis]|uniref:4Fe-4S ferredoxin n=1 Tax=Desulfuribacillus stibiiarsenatis TaxID=1390249 RepID=A0A1E5L5J7_9FIRM|nr:4Fe-4S dicluster domain-containing protein [Desulfuribacillus stibiiarsenatis]OEH85405.1 4Fe-4S ferredoxin [Desulfuribacillus stibiiarsenatis]